MIVNCSYRLIPVSLVIHCALFKLACCVNELQVVMTDNKLMVNPEKKRSSSLPPLRLIMGACGTIPSILEMLKFTLLVQLEIWEQSLIAIWKWTIMLLNCLAPWTSRLGIWKSRNQKILGLWFLPIMPSGPLSWPSWTNVVHFCVMRLRKSLVAFRCARLIKKNRSHSSPLLKELHWLPVVQRVQFRTLVHTLKSLNNLSPSYLSCRLHLRQSAYTTRSSTRPTTHFHVPRTRTLFGDRAFSTATPRL